MPTGLTDVVVYLLAITLFAALLGVLFLLAALLAASGRSRIATPAVVSQRPPGPRDPASPPALAGAETTVGAAALASGEPGATAATRSWSMSAEDKIADVARRAGRRNYCRARTAF
jgi:hypothetical protein